MTADALKSASITSLDAVASSGAPIAIPTAGAGSKRRVCDTRDFVTPTAAGLADTGSKYKVVRVPTNAKVKKVTLIADAALDSGSPSLAVDVGAYYSDSTTDGTPAANQGTNVNSGKNDFIANAAFAQGASTLVISSDGTWGAANKQKALWDALGLSTDPGGNFDIVMAVHVAANTAASHAVEMVVEFDLD